MDFFSQTAARGSPILEFPHSGDYSAWSPHQQHHHHSSPLDQMLHPSYATPHDPYHHHQAQMFPSFGQNTVVYQVPENVPLEIVLRQLGVDVSSLHQTGIDQNHYMSGSLPMHFPMHHNPRGRRRRLVCYETSDSEDDDYRHHGRHRRHSYHANFNQQQPNEQGSPRIHNLLNQRRNSDLPQGNLPHSNSTPNMNSLWQNMSRTASADPQQGAAVNNAWHAMHNAADSSSYPPPGPGPAPPVNNSGGPPPNFLANMFNRMREAPGTVIQPPPQPPPPQQNQAAANNFFAARNVAPGYSQPPPAPAYPPPQLNPSAVNNFFAARNVASGAPQPSPSVGNVWNRVEGAIQNAPPPPPPPGPSASNFAWNQMRQYSPPPPAPPSYQPFPRGPQAAPAPVGAPASFASLLSQAHQQHSPYAGSM